LHSYDQQVFFYSISSGIIIKGYMKIKVVPYLNHIFEWNNPLRIVKNLKQVVYLTWSNKVEHYKLSVSKYSLDIKNTKNKVQLH
jgi:hypothetical protein